MIGHDIVVIGASAGGVEALKVLVSLLPADLDAAIFIVLHVPSYGHSALPEILSRAGVLPAVHPTNGQAVEKGHIYIAPPDNHMLLERGVIRLSHGPKENTHRPAIDPMFRSASRAYGNRVIGVVLTGVLDDGTAGLLAVKIVEGVRVVQDPEEAMYAGMPISAIENDHVEYILTIAEIAKLLVKLSTDPIDESKASKALQIAHEVKIAEMETKLDDTPPGKPAVFACPDCGGTLWELEEGNLVRFRCRVGHAFSAQSLLASQSDTLEDAFWIALRALEESAALARRMAARATESARPHSAVQFAEQAKTAEHNAKIIRDVLEKGVLKSNIDLMVEKDFNNELQ
jgi:two-component system chemotaxis response regulator CheB